MDKTAELSADSAAITSSMMESGDKRKPSHERGAEDQDLIELPPQPKRPILFEVVDLTDD